MLEAATYFVTLSLFAFVVFGTVYVRHETLILACIPPVFVAMIVGFIMWIYAYETFGLPWRWPRWWCRSRWPGAWGGVIPCATC